MQQQESSVPENLSEILDEALTRISKGEGIEACLEDYPQHAPALERLLQTGALLQAEAATPLRAAASPIVGGVKAGARSAAGVAPAGRSGRCW